MGDRGSRDSPLAGAAGAAGPHTTEAFQLLANETRLAILLALWEAKDPPSDDEAVPFSDLYDSIDIDDSGNFNYHLEKLEGHFVRSTEDGYQLEPAGSKVVRAVIAGTGISEPSLEPTEIDMACPLCGATTEITYEGDRLFQVCTECEGNIEASGKYPAGTLYSWRLDPAALSDRDPEDVYLTTSLGLKQRIVGMVDGVCPACSGPVESRLDVCDDHEVGDDTCQNCGRRYRIEAVFYCTVCKNWSGGPRGTIVAQHPAVVSFYFDHGIEYQYDPDFGMMQRALELVQGHEERLVSESPVRVQVTIRHEGDELRLTLDEEMSVVEVEE